MHVILRTLRAAAVLSAMSVLGVSPAQAETFDLGTLEFGETLSFEQQASSFSDSFRFTVGAPVDFTLDFENLGLGSRATLSVFLNGNEIVGTFGRNLTFAWGPFASGGGAFPFASGTEFLFTVHGTDGILTNPSYRLGITAAVPEPASVAMMLSGLAAIAVAVRRRMRAG